MFVGPSWQRYHIVVAPRASSVADPQLDLTPRLQQWTKTALHHHENGDNGKATQILKRMLISAPGHSDSWHLFGLLRHMQGHSAYGAACMRVAIDQVMRQQSAASALF